MLPDVLSTSAVQTQEKALLELSLILPDTPILEYCHFQIQEDKKKILCQLSFGFGNVQEGCNVVSLEAITVLGSKF